MGGGKGPKRAYKPKYEGLAEDVLYGQAFGTIAQQNPSIGRMISGQFQPQGSSGIPIQGTDPNMRSISVGSKRPLAQGQKGGVAQMGMKLPRSPAQEGMDAIRGGRTMTGQQIPQYQSTYDAGKAFQFKTPDIRPLATEAYEGALGKSLEGIQKAQEMAGAQAGRQMSGRGLGRGGLAAGQQNTLARQAMQQGADVARDLALEQARTNVDIDRFLAQQDLARQQLQAGEFSDLARRQLAGDQQALAAQQALTGLQMQQIGALGTLEQQALQRQMAPYNMLRDLYAMGVGAPVAQSGKGDPLGSLISAGGQIGAAALCLPEGTMIEINQGIKPVEDIQPGEVVKGGVVLVTTRRLRPPGHKFFRHQFNKGEVIMSNGHPHEDTLKEIEEVDHDSPFTYDILTSDGYYYVNGIKLRSTLKE